MHQLAAHDHKSPAWITEEELRYDFLSLTNVKHYARSASTIVLCGIKFFYEHTLKRQWPTLTFVRAPREQKLPVIFSVEEVRTILAHLKLFPMGVSDDYLLLWTALARGHPPAGPRY